MNRKIACFDLDGTIIDGTVYIWQTLYEKYISDHTERKRLMSAFFSGEISYADWFFGDISILSKANVSRGDIINAVSSFSLMPGALETLSELKRKGHITAVISGSLNIVLEKFLPQHLLDYAFINEIYFDEHGHISGGKPTDFDMDNKALGLEFIAQREGIDVADTVFVGDNDNDVAIASRAGFSIAFNCKSAALAKVCDVEITDKNLRKILTYF